MDRSEADAFLAANTKGVLLTIRGNGRPQASNIVYTYADGVIRISVTNNRAKTRNVVRDPRASLHVTSDDFWAFVVAEADVELSDVTREPGDVAGRELAEVYEAISGGPHPDWDEFHAAMVAEERRVMRLCVTHVYGQL